MNTQLFTKLMYHFYIPEDRSMKSRGRCMNQYPENIIPNLVMVHHNW